jgi:DNA end-binding protein Ku
MAERAYWKGHVRLSLVSFPVRLHAATTTTQKISLHKLDKETGERVHYKETTNSKNDVPKENIVKGYEYEKDRYVPIESEELDKLKVESKHTIDLVQFTDIKDVDPIYFDKPYYLVPDGDIALEAYTTVREALKKSGKTALGQIVLGSRERIAAIRPCDSGLILETLRYDYEVREAQRYFEDIPEDVQVDKEQIDLAQQLINSKTKEFNPKDFKDHYQESLKEIINAKLEGKEIVEGKEEKGKPGKVVNIMDALKKSVEESKKGGERRAG